MGMEELDRPVAMVASAMTVMPDRRQTQTLIEPRRSSPERPVMPAEWAGLAVVPSVTVMGWWPS